MHGRGTPPPTPSPLVSNTLLNIKKRWFPPPPPIYCNHYILGARVEVNLNLITHQKPGFSTRKSKNVPTVGGGYPLPHPSPSWFLIHNHFKHSSALCDKNALSKHIRLSGKDTKFGQKMLCPPPPLTEMVPYAYVTKAKHKDIKYHAPSYNPFNFATFHF